MECKKIKQSYSKNNIWPYVSVIVLNRNGIRQIQKCFNAILNIDYPNYEVIFVDNRSNDGSLELAKHLAEDATPPCSFVELKENIGYSRGKNVGASMSKGQYLWLLDNDIEPDPDCLQKLVSFMDTHQEVALSGPVLVDYINRKQVIGGGYFMSRIRQPQLSINVSYKVNDFQYVSFISGGVIFVRKKVWNQLGGFAESGMFYLDDNDFGPRCWIAGWKVALVKDCLVRHLRLSRTSFTNWRWMFRQFTPGIIRGMIRNYTFKSLIVAIPAFLIYILLKAFKNALCRLEPKILIDCAVSILKVGKDLPESFRQRKAVAKFRVVQGDPFLDL